MRTISLGLTIASALGIAAFAGQVQAATEYSMIVLDQTGSMVDPSTVNNIPQDGAPVGTGTKFDSAITAAINWVVTDRQDQSNTRLYAIYTFKDDTCCSGTQTGLLKIWPKSTTGTTPGCSSSAHVTSDLFCSMDKDAGYDGVITLLNTLRPLQQTTANPPTTIGGDPNHLLNPINDSKGNPITTGGASFDQTAYGLGPNTPLANSICKGVDHLVKLAQTQLVTVTLETDGNENYSTYQALKACSGTNSGLSDPNATAFPKTSSDWGLPVGSWQGNVMRRLVRLVGTYAPASDPLASAANATANDTVDGKAINAGAIKAKGATGAEDVPPQTTWRIDVHYAICDPNYPQSPAPCTPTTPTAAVAAPLATMHALLSLEQPTFSPAPLPPPRKAQAANGTVTTLAAAAPLATTTTGRTQSLPATELSYFKALGHVTPKSSFRAFVRDPLTATTKHVPKYPGDVDDSGCVDMADYNIVTQKDVYYKATVDSSNNQVNQLAVRADLDGDGWVTKMDAMIVVANWAKGDKNCKKTQPVPVIKF